jgi:hypothetical protein
MTPKIFRLSDLKFMSVPLAILLLIVGALVWNVRAGEPLENLAIGISGVTSAMVVGLVVWFYVQRWRWVRKFAYTIRGVQYFYESGTVRYGATVVTDEIRETLNRWSSYYRSIGREPAFIKQVDNGTFIKGLVCVFRPEARWLDYSPTFGQRWVAGVARQNILYVGQGGRRLAETAHQHELSHPLLRRIEGHYIDEETAHEIFRIVGVL